MKSRFNKKEAQNLELCRVALENATSNVEIEEALGLVGIDAASLAEGKQAHDAARRTFDL